MVKGKKVRINEIECTYFEATNNKISFIFSGTGYTYDKPALYYTTQILLEKGFDVIQVHYSFKQELFNQSEDVISQTIYGCVNAVVESQLEQKAYEKILFIGKSLGTIPIITHYMQQKFDVPVQFINFTPILSMNLIVNKLQQAPSESLMIIGTADSNYDEDTLRTLSQHRIKVVSNANHSLDIENDAVQSIQILKQILDEVVLFI